jgi:hypothetical protein
MVKGKKISSAIHPTAGKPRIISRMHRANPISERIIGVFVVLFMAIDIRWFDFSSKSIHVSLWCVLVLRS